MKKILPSKTLRFADSEPHLPQVLLVANEEIEVSDYIANCAIEMGVAKLAKAVEKKIPTNNLEKKIPDEEVIPQASETKKPRTTKK